MTYVMTQKKMLQLGTGRHQERRKGHHKIEKGRLWGERVTIFGVCPLTGTKRK
jgi:hypothetical protein